MQNFTLRVAHRTFYRAVDLVSSFDFPNFVKTGGHRRCLDRTHGLNKEVRLARHEDSHFKTVRPLSPNSYALVVARLDPSRSAPGKLAKNRR
jgi:hypothetical protein